MPALAGRGPHERFVASGPLRIWTERVGDRRLPAVLMVMGSAAQGDQLSITAPTSIVHGDQDPVHPLGHGEALAAAIPGVGMGHVMTSPGLPEEVADLIRL
nr:hypothetical protein [uncultured Actinoplanes sp.]